MSLTATLDKPVYAPGATVTLTVVSDKRLTSAIIPVTAAGEGANATLTVCAGVFITDPQRPWTLVSDDGKTAVFTATA